MFSVVFKLIEVFLFVKTFSNDVSETNEMELKNINNNLEYPRIIWSFYDRELPLPIREMVDTTLENIEGKWKFYFLTYENVSSYIDISKFPPWFYGYLPAHQSDFIRLLLLEKYGGWWIDSSIIINDNLVLEDLYKECVDKKCELVAICNKQCPRKMIENSFFYAPKGSEVIKEWVKEVSQVHELGRENYMYSLYRTGVTIPSDVFWPKYPVMSPYLSSFAAQQKALDRLVPRNTSLVIHKGQDLLFKLNYDCKLNIKCIKKNYMNKNKRKEYPIIKLNSYVRLELFKRENTVTAYDSFVEPHELKEGMNISLLLLFHLCVGFTLKFNILSLFFMLFVRYLSLSLHIPLSSIIYLGKNNHIL